MRREKFYEILAFLLAGFFCLAVAMSAVSNIPELSPHETEPAWWIKALFAGFVSALVIILAFILDRLAGRLKKRKIRDEFANSVCVELRHVLARLVNNCCNLRARLGKANGNIVKWYQKAYLDFDLFTVTDPAEQIPPMPKEANKPMSDKDADDIAGMLNRNGCQPDISFIDIPKIEFGFIANNLPSASMLDSKDQLLLFTIINRLHAINGLIAHLKDEYERSFTAATDDRPSIEANKRSYYEKIADQSYFTANEIAEFLKANKVCHSGPTSQCGVSSSRNPESMDSVSGTE